MANIPSYMYSLPKLCGISLPIILVFMIFSSCTRSISSTGAQNLASSDSDPKAISIANQVMEANGGQEAWQNLTYVKWNFFGSRLHIWNKKTDDYVIKGLKEDYLIKGNLHESATYLALGGQQITHPDSLSKYGNKAKSMWNNDAYWLFMPYKLKDQGVTLKYISQEKDMLGNDADKLAMTYTAVGDTPDNKYIIYVDQTTKLITQWDFYPLASDEEPRFQIPWTEYLEYDGVMLASSRGDKYQITEIETGPSLARYFK